MRSAADSLLATVSALERVGGVSHGRGYSIAHAAAHSRHHAAGLPPGVPISEPAEPSPRMEQGGSYSQTYPINPAARPWPGRSGRLLCIISVRPGQARRSVPPARGRGAAPQLRPGLPGLDPGGRAQEPLQEP